VGGMRLALCIPCHGEPRFGFTMHAIGLALRAQAQGLQVSVHGWESSNLPDGRNRIAAMALEEGADWLLWLDADMEPPVDAAARLLAHRKPLVGTNYLKRDGSKPVAIGMDGRPLQTSAEIAAARPLERARTTGMGCLLTSAEIFHAVKRPWFAGGREDVHFLSRAGELWIDQALSMEIGHIGEMVYRFT
jgi:hypothetical protein